MENKVFAKIKDGQVVKIPYGLSDLMAENPGTVFSSTNLDELFAATEEATIRGFQVVACRFALNDAYDMFAFREGEFEARQENGEWVARQKLIPLTDAEKAESLRLLTAQMRGERSRRLQFCDWTQLPDALVDKAAWAAYRQALRDVPTQAGFPFNIQWPEQPA